MRSVTVLAAAALGAVICGCSQQQAGAPAGPPLAGASSPPPAGAPPLPAGASPPPPASSPSPPPPGTPPAGTCHGGPAPRLRVITLTNADNGRLVCVRRGTAVLVYLRGTQASRWSVIHASSGVLQPRANGHGLLPAGVTGASFVAARPGTAAVASFRLVCPTPPPNTGAQSGTEECGAILGFRVSVRVS
jgi:hypothetical protein